MLVAEKYKDEIIKLHKSGLSYIKIGEKVGIDSSSVARGLKKWGFTTNFPKNTEPLYRAGKYMCNKCGKYKNKEDFILKKDGKFRFQFCGECKGGQWVEACHSNYVSFISHELSQIKYRAKKTKLSV